MQGDSLRKALLVVFGLEGVNLPAESLKNKQQRRSNYNPETEKAAKRTDNRLTYVYTNESRSYETGLASNVWNPLSYGNSYYNAFTYNADGNILTQQRHKRDGTQIEDLTYRYQRNSDGDLIRNRLYHVNDAIASNVDDSDIDCKLPFCVTSC